MRAAAQDDADLNDEITREFNFGGGLLRRAAGPERDVDAPEKRKTKREVRLAARAAFCVPFPAQPGFRVSRIVAHKLPWESNASRGRGTHGGQAGGTVFSQPKHVRLRA